MSRLARVVLTLVGRFKLETLMSFIITAGLCLPFLLAKVDKLFVLKFGIFKITLQSLQ